MFLNDLPTDRYPAHRDQLLQAFAQVRQRTLTLTAALSAEDMQLQSMPDASPGKWHLAHTTWFFEAFILQQHQRGFAWYDPAFAHLYNSYYNAMGEQYPRPARGLISRPSLEAVRQYRQAIEGALTKLLGACEDRVLAAVAPLLVLGINHEQQHQELILTDLKHAMFQNPEFPALRKPPAAAAAAELQWLQVEGGDSHAGFDGEGFCFDNELPRHRVLLEDFSIASRPVSNREWLDFVDDGGYRQALLWLSDGWSWRQCNHVAAPLYWLQRDGEWSQYTLAGVQPLDPDAPVRHVSYYEADAYARWADLRLPTEFEWEHAARALGSRGPAAGSGQCWEWTASPYAPYPGFRPASGNVGEYNGKFMINQMVLRGASSATAPGHSRPSYRNFFYPDARWQFSGLRLVRPPA